MNLLGIEDHSESYLISTLFGEFFESEMAGLVFPCVSIYVSSLHALVAEVPLFGLLLQPQEA